MAPEKNHSPAKISSLPIVKEKKFVYPLLLSFLLLLTVPELITWNTEPDGLIFNGAFINITDFNVYLSAIRQGAEGNWLFSPQFTPETFPPYLSFLPYVLAGKLLSLFGGGVILWFLILKYAAWILTIIALFELVNTVFPQKIRLQKTALLMIFYSSGVGWIFMIFFKKISPFTPDIFVPEWNLMTASYAAPHFLLGIALQAAFFSSFYKLTTRPAASQALKYFLIGIGLSLVYPYQIVVNGLVTAAYFANKAIESRNIFWNQLATVGLLSTPMISALIYYGFYLPQNPIYREVIVSNNDISPPPIAGILIGFGLLVPLAVTGLTNWWKYNYPKIIVVWLVMNLTAIYLPLSFSGRFTTGLFIPLCLIAASGFEEIVLQKCQDLIVSRVRTTVISLTIPSTILFVLYIFLVINSYPIFPYYNRTEDVTAAQWLGENTTDQDLVLAAFPFNNLLPRYGKGRVFFGHFDLTIDMEGRFGIMDKFWDPQTPESWRQEFIDEWGFTYLYQGYYENALTGEKRLNFPYEVIYTTDEVTIYHIP